MAWTGICSMRSGRFGCHSLVPVAPYVIFHDTTLRELARARPTTLDALRHIYGVGARKADDLGATVLDLIRERTGSPASGH
jgi:ATP-dependent DNA helicase RecQ